MNHRSTTYRFTKVGEESVLILPGVNEGIESDFLKSVEHKAITSGYSVLATNFPHHDKNEKQSSGPDLIAESKTIMESIARLVDKELLPIHIIAKSLGSTALSYIIEKNPEIKKCISKITILGMPIGDVKTSEFEGIDVSVIQGSEDRYGNVQSVADEFEKAGIKLNQVVEIKGGDHSYRDQDRQPTYQQDAIDSIIF